MCEGFMYSLFKSRKCVTLKTGAAELTERLLIKSIRSTYKT